MNRLTHRLDEQDIEPKYTRRGVTKAALGFMAAGTLVGCGEAAKSNSTSGDSEKGSATEEAPSVQDNSIGGVESAEPTPISFETNPDLTQILGYDLDAYRVMAEESPRDFHNALKLTESEVPEPELYAELFAPRFGVSLGLGCTAADAEPFFKANEDGSVDVDVDGYFAAMDDKYTLPAFNSLFRELQSGKEENNQDYVKFRQARRSIGLHFLRHAHKTGVADNAPVVTMTSSEDPSVKGTGYYKVRMTFSVTNDLGNDDLSKDIYGVEETISVGVDPARDGRLEAGLTVHEPWDALFNELARINK